jgi:hypothetical protein
MPDNVLTIKLDAIQPSQLYISMAKLKRLMSRAGSVQPELLEPIPVRRLGDSIIFTDGHTRAFAAFLKGLSQVRVCWDSDDLDIDAYETCGAWCKQEGIHTIADLQGRVVSPGEYEVLWLLRCEEMQRDLDARRNRD